MEIEYEKLPIVTRLSERVIRVLGGNPGKFALQGTNTYIVGTGKRRLLIDTGEGKAAWLSNLRDTLAAEDIEIESAILTHRHHDHVGGVKQLADLSPSTVLYKNEPGDRSIPGGGDNVQTIADKQRFPVEGATLVALHTPGHTTDHMCLYLEEEDALFTGDNVLGHGTSVFEDLLTYVRSLERMRNAFKGRVYPAHGQIAEDGPAKVREYISHRAMRERQIIKVLRGEWSRDSAGKNDWSSWEITEALYGDVPRDLWPHAERGIVQVLEKLQAEDPQLATLDEDGRWEPTEMAWQQKVAGPSQGVL